MKHCSLLILAIVIASNANAQTFDKVQPAGKVRNVLLAKPIVLADEVAATARDLVTFRDKQWTILTFAQIGAASADAATSLNNLHDCASCQETGASRFFVSRHPDAHKYIVAGAVEIGVEAVTAHYLGNHGPTRKWYWRFVWTLPQTLSLYEHARAANHNAGLNLDCYTTRLHC